MSDRRKNIVIRFGIIYFIVLVLFGAVVTKIIIIQTTEREQWLQLAQRQTKSDIIVNPNRGNIYSCDGQLMASSIPTYYIYMDTRVPALHEKNGSLYKDYIDSVSHALADFFKDRPASEYKKMISHAYNRGDGSLLLYPKRITFSQLKAVQQMPLFNKGRYKSGLISRQQYRRVKPFGSLASRTIGDIYADETKGGKNGLELYFNEELKGVPGISTRQKAANRYVNIIEVEPQDGMDIISTIDITLQDIAEKSLLEMLNKIEAHSGYVVMLETHTGEVKAIVNMQRGNDGNYYELRNGVVADMAEPGSTFKTASLMAAIDDGKINIWDSIDTGNGIFMFHNVPMRDHNAHRGGFGKITVQNTLEASSNVGISRVIVNAYDKNPADFVDKLYEMGLNEPLELEIPGTAKPNIRSPKDKNSHWSGTTLPWMSIGYEVQIPPIYTVTFYNAIANGGKMVKPFFVKEIRQDGHTVKTFGTETIRSSICSDRTLEQIRTALEGVVWSKHYATAGAARSDKVHIAGKTGTAQISRGHLGYKGGGKAHQVSFCGFFPFDDPQYTCLCVIREPGPNFYPSGGTMCGTVVRQIAERTMANKIRITPEQIAATEDFKAEEPTIKRGMQAAIKTVAKDVGLHLSGEQSEWARVNGEMEFVGMDVSPYLIPRVIGMGAKDAVYAIERTGMKAVLEGRGRVVSQSIPEGGRAVKGKTIILKLQ